MKKDKDSEDLEYLEISVEKWRRVTPKETEMSRKAIEAFTGKSRPPRIGRPLKSKKDKYVPISLRIHPNAIKWLKAQAKKSLLPYQTVLNNLILAHIK